MNSSSSILIVTNNGSFSKEAAVYFKEFFPSEITLRSVSFYEALKEPKESAPLIVLVDLSESEQFVFSLVQKITSHFTHSRIVCAGHPADVSIVLELVKMGVKDFLKIPFQAEEIKTLADQTTNFPVISAIGKAERKSKVITVYSPKGGTGVTLTTVNLAVALAKDPKHQVAVCDFAPQCGDVATYLNLSPKYTVWDIIENNPFLDISFLEGVMLKHSSGVKVLPAPGQDQEAPTTEHLGIMENILALLKTSFDTILIDGTHLSRELLDYMMSESDLIFLAGNPDVVSLKGLVNSFNKLRAMGVDPTKIKVLINRYNSKSRIDVKEFEKKTKHPITAHLPNDFLLCIEAINTGEAISKIREKSDLAKKFAQISELILESSESSDSNGAKREKSFELNLPRWAHGPQSMLRKRSG